MSDSSDCLQDPFNNSEISHSTPLTDPADLNGSFGEQTTGTGESYGFDNVGWPESSNTIDPQLLDLRLQNGYCRIPFTQAATEPSAGETTNELFRSLAPGDFARANEGPWTAQTHFHSEAAGQRAEGPLATGPRTLIHPVPPEIQQNFWQQYNGLAIAAPAALLERCTPSSELDSASSQDRCSSSGSSNKVAIPATPKSSSLESDSPTGSLSCERCGTSFTRLGDLSRHMRDKHGVTSLYYQCDKCDYNDARLDKVKEHCRAKHGQQKDFERYMELFGTPSRVKRPRGPNKNPPKTKTRR